MRCDKLTLYHSKSLNSPIYVASEVDDAIAELKEKLHDVDNQWNEQCKEIAELKAKLENACATVAFNHLDAVTRARRLRRALWLARALRARDIQRWWLSATLAPITERACRVWNNIEIKCLKKAEEYK